MLNKIYLLIHSYFIGLIKRIPLWQLFMMAVVVYCVCWIIFRVCKKQVRALLILGLSLSITIIIAYTLMNRQMNSLDANFSLDSLFYSYHLLIDGNQAVHGLFEIFANLLLFVPLGFFLRQIHPKKWQCIGMIILIAVCVEGTQLLLRMGRFELSDIIDNSIGGVLGWNAGLRYMSRKITL